MAEQQEVLANFMAITDADEAQALPLLEASDWKLEEACNLFFASSMAGSGAGGAAGGAQGAGTAAGGGEDDVRAPMPTITDRLVGGPGISPYALEGGMMRAAGPYGTRGRPQPAVDVFRSFEDEGKGGSKKGANPALSNLFAPPSGLLFQASCVCVCESD